MSEQEDVEFWKDLLPGDRIFVRYNGETERLWHERLLLWPVWLFDSAQWAVCTPDFDHYVEDLRGRDECIEEVYPVGRESRVFKTKDQTYRFANAIEQKEVSARSSARDESSPRRSRPGPGPCISCSISWAPRAQPSGAVARLALGRRRLGAHRPPAAALQAPGWDLPRASPLPLAYGVWRSLSTCRARRSSARSLLATRRW